MLKGRAVYVPLDAAFPTGRLALITANAGLRLVLTHSRFLLVSGESCPQDLVARWHRPCRRFLNVYGPTEATVTATWTVLDPGRPVTIGVPIQAARRRPRVPPCPELNIENNPCTFVIEDSREEPCPHQMS